MKKATNKQIFDLAMALIDEVEATGIVSESNTAEYKGKTPFILTLINEDLIHVGVVPYEESSILTLSDINTKDSILPYEIAVNVAPYGLANYLLLDENQSLASALGQEYENRKANIRLTPHIIEDKYNMLGGMCSW